MANKVASWFRSQTRKSAADELILFVHIPKCAGTTVIRSLGHLGRRRQIVVSGTGNSKTAAYQYLQQEIQGRHLSADRLQVIMGHDVFLGMHEVSHRRPWYCTLLRDPVQRYISHYRYLVDCVGDPTSRQHEFATAKLVEDGEVIGLSEFVGRGEMANVMTNYLAAANHPNRESGRWYVRDGRELIDLASGMLQRMSFVGLVDHMPGDLHTICEKAGAQPVSGIVNPSHANVLAVDDPELIDRIRELNSLDQQIYDLACGVRREKPRPSASSPNA